MTGSMTDDWKQRASNARVTLTVPISSTLASFERQHALAFSLVLYPTMYGVLWQLIHTVQYYSYHVL